MLAVGSMADLNAGYVGYGPALTHEKDLPNP